MTAVDLTRADAKIILARLKESGDLLAAFRRLRDALESELEWRRQP